MKESNNEIMKAAGVISMIIESENVMKASKKEEKPIIYIESRK